MGKQRPNYGPRGWLYTTKGEQRVVVPAPRINRRLRRLIAQERRRG